MSATGTPLPLSRNGPASARAALLPTGQLADAPCGRGT